MAYLVYQILLIEENKDEVNGVFNQFNELDIECEINFLDSSQEIERTLENNHTDLIIGNYNYFNSNGFAELESVRELHPKLPIIIISESSGEEHAVNVMKRGASDYILKSNYEKLQVAVKRELTQYRHYRETETKLKSTQKRYQGLIQSIDGIVWEADSNTFEFLYVSPQSRQILGYDPSEWYDDKNFWQNHIHLDDRNRVINFCREKTKVGENHEFEYRMINSKAEPVWLRDHVTVVFENGQPSRLRGIMVDITHQKDTELELDEAIKKLKERIKEQECLYKISSLDQQDLTIGEMLSKSVHFIPDGFQYPEICEASIEYDGEIYQTDNFEENDQGMFIVSDEVEKKTWTIKVVYTEKKPTLDIGPFFNEEQNLLTSIAKNLGLKINRKIGQNELFEKQDLLQKAYDLAKIGNWEFDVGSSEVTWSQKTKEIHDVPDDFKPTPAKLKKLYKKSKDWLAIQKSIENLIENGTTVDQEFKVITSKGNERWVRVIGQPEYKNAECVRVYGAIQDIDHRKRAEEELQKNEQRLKALVQEGLDLIAIVDEKGKYKYIAPTNQRFEEMGMKPEDYIGESAFSIFHSDDVGALIKKLKNLKPNESSEIGPVRYKRKKDGEWRWMESTITNLTENPAIDGYVTNSRDVTERIEQKKLLQDIVENSTNLFYKHDVYEDNSFSFTYISPQSSDFLGCEPEVAKERWETFITDHRANEAGYQLSIQAIESGEPQGSYEMQLQKVNGEKIWVEVNEAPIVEDGKTVAVVGSLTNITEQKKYEEKLEELSLVAAKTTDIIIMSDVDIKITWVNKAFEEWTGYTLEECIGRYPGEFLHGPETNPVTDKILKESLSNQKTAKVTILNYRKNGQKYWVDMTIDPFFDNNGEYIGNIAIQKNVTEKIEREKKLRESVERYDIVTKATSDTIWDADLVNNTVTFNSNIYEVFGYDAERVENSGSWWANKIHPEDQKRVEEEFSNAELAKVDRAHVEYRFRCADGNYKYVFDRAFVINDEEGNPVRMIGAMQDITKQKEKNLWLKLLESAIANSTEAIAIVEEKKPDNPLRNILYINDAFEKMTGFSKNEALGNSLLKFIGPKTDKREISRAIKSLDRGQNYQLEICYPDKSGDERWAHISFAPVKYESGNYSHWVCIGRDVTDRRKRISQLSESLQEKETLLMEIHHRVKNNLAVVSSMMQLQAMEEQSELLQKKLYDSVARIRTMVTIHEMLYESGSFSKLDFSVNIKKLVFMITQTIHNQKKIDVEFNCDNVELNVNQAIPSSLIVNEVITNSLKHAFKDKKSGKIVVSLKERENQIHLKVIDNGYGLPDSFNKLGSSSLGLQLIDVLTKQMDASYNFTSSSGQGTEFSIQFEKTMLKGIGNAYLK